LIKIYQLPDQQNIETDSQINLRNQNII